MLHCEHDMGMFWKIPPHYERFVPQFIRGKKKKFIIEHCVKNAIFFPVSVENISRRHRFCGIRSLHTLPSATRCVWIKSATRPSPVLSWAIKALIFPEIPIMCKIDAILVDLDCWRTKEHWLWWRVVVGSILQLQLLTLDQKPWWYDIDYLEGKNERKKY